MFQPGSSPFKQFDMAAEDDHDARDDDEQFRRHVAGTKRLKNNDRVPPHRPKIAPRARFSREDNEAALAESLSFDIEEMETSSSETLRFNRSSVGRRTMRKLARGSYSVQDELDLHGMTVAEARPALRAFIDANRRRGNGCIRIVHGKGHGSGERGPVLKSKVNAWLRKWDEVLAFVSARQFDGGTGAVYVLLKTD